MKNIRNNWLRDKMGTLKFCLSPNKTVCNQWSHMKELLDFVQKSMVKQSHLTKASAHPNNIEKQKVSLALYVFSEKISAAALKTSASSNTSESDTTTSSRCGRHSTQKHPINIFVLVILIIVLLICLFLVISNQLFLIFGLLKP